MSGEGEVGALSWYALRTMPTREQMVAKILRYGGVKAHVKTEKRLRRKTKRDKVRTEQEFVAASGYCFVGLDDRVPNPWTLVHNWHQIKSVVSYGGRPVLLNPVKLAAFLDFDDYSLPDYFKFFETKGEPDFIVGDMVRVCSGSLEGFNLPVQEIRAGEAIFHLMLFGKQVEMAIPWIECVKAKAA